MMRALAASALFLSGATATNLFACDVNEFYEGFNPRAFDDAELLKAEIRTFIDNHTIIPYTLTDEAMMVLDKPDSGEGDIIAIYAQIPKTGFPAEWNREHLWPRSKGVGDTGPDTSDLHHLYPSDVQINNERANKFFDECSAGSSGCEVPAGTATEKAAEGSSETAAAWAPPDVMKGDVARAIFYMTTRYDGSEPLTNKLVLKECATDSECGENSFGRLSTLLKWHQEDPPSEREIRRNNQICTEYQGNRNPYVDFPELVDVVFNGGSLPEEETVDVESTKAPVATNDDENGNGFETDAFDAASHLTFSPFLFLIVGYFLG